MLQRGRSVGYGGLSVMCAGMRSRWCGMTISWWLKRWEIQTVS